MTRELTAAAEESLHCTTSMEYEEVVDTVMLEHELAGFETIAVNEISGLVEELPRELYDSDVDVQRTTLVIVCHARIAKRTLDLDPALTSLLPCATAVYESDDDDRVHVHHKSITKAIRDLGFCPDRDDEIEELVEVTGELMEDVWRNLEEQLE